MAFESGEEDGQDFAFKLLGIVVAILMLGTFLEGIGFSNVTGIFSGGFLNRTEEVDSEDSKNLSFTESMLSSNLDLGDQIVSSKTLTVYHAPAGNPLGNQMKGTKGRVVEGPVNSFNLKWWRVDYEKAPSGWVDGALISNKIGMFTFLNIIPITMSTLRPVAVILSIIILVLIIITILKGVELNGLTKKRLAQKEEQEIIQRRDSTPPVEEEYSVENNETPEEEIELPVPNLPVGKKPQTESPSNRRWSNIQTLAKSYNQNDWKQAIIEADTILEEMLEKIGYEGNSIGDRLKQANPGDFLTINHAWEAHKTRNRIAHDGGKFTLSKDEAERVISLYEEVFKEFYYI